MLDMHSIFWAKSLTHTSLLYKSVAHHNLDVAASASKFLEGNPARLNRETWLTGFSAHQHVQFCALLAGLHDLGKISRSFQCLNPTLWPEPVLGQCPGSLPLALRHWEATAVLLHAAPVKMALAPVFSADGLDDQLLAAIAGHHGIAPCQDIMDAHGRTASRHVEIGSECVQAATELCGELVRLFPDLHHLEPVAEPEALSFALNGLITLSDWIGSDSYYFPPEPPGTPVECYWPIALRRAEAAVRAKGLLPARSAPQVSLGAISGQENRQRPMQKAAMDLPLDAEPQIVIIEDGTGSGKTEAALLLAHRMIKQGLAEGFFVALPTMATANAMHSRLEKAMPGLFQGEASLVLAHGKTAIANALHNLAAGDGGDPESSAASRWFNAWISDSRKKSFFADAGAGTIDQAFLSILPKKHLTMRQYALAGRILIVDEAHACDAYMGEELKTLVEMQARLRGSVIVLSATLGRSMRAELVKSFAKGRGIHPSKEKMLTEAISSEAYPLLTRWSSSSGVQEIAVKGDPALSRRVSIARIGSRNETVAAARAAAREGAAVAIICNAVDAASEVWTALLQAGHPPERCHLFHARFAMEDRLNIEAQVQVWFGRNSTSQERQGRILVATQVIEQSLDVDFDMMISDLAPADLLIQRAGRLWRHKRNIRPTAEPVLHILSPEPAADVKSSWLTESLGPASYVYQLPGVMWRSANEVFRKGSLYTPGDLRNLIETVYAATGDDLPEALQPGHGSSVGTGYAKTALAQHNTIKPSDGYLSLNAVSSDEDIGTRLGERSLTIRLARREGAELIPLHRRDGVGDRLNWPLSEITLREGWLKRACGGTIPEPADMTLVETTRAQWPEWERRITIYEVEKSGLLRDAPLIYSSSAGLSMHKA